MNLKETIKKMTLEDKVKLCSGNSFWSTETMEQYGIREIIMNDGPHGLRKQGTDEGDHLGINKSEPATCFPTASASASTWNIELMERMGEAIGEEALELKTDIVLGPGVNMKRNPLCGRNFEYFSEDPYLAGKLGAAWVKGVQRKGPGTSVKHFAANNQENERLLSDSLVDERTLREIYLRAFEIVVNESNPTTVMCSYNKVNGAYLSENMEITKHILRDEWGYNGVVVTDWGAMNDRIGAFKAGVELEMPYSGKLFDREVIEAVHRGELSETEIDACVERLLTLIEGQITKRKDYHFDREAHHKLACHIAQEGAVLLKNEDNLLPIKKDKKIALLGAMADQIRYQGSGSSHINPTKLTSILEAMKSDGYPYVYEPGYEIWEEQKDIALLQDKAIEAAKAAELVVIVIGLTDAYESEGYDRTHMRIPESHVALLEKVSKVNQNIIVVLLGGSPVEMPWIDKAKAVLNMYLGGQAVGEACVNLLYGNANPSGKLAETYPLRYEDVTSSDTFGINPRQVEYAEGIYIGYRYYQKAKVPVRFPFGYGLSYTTFTYSDLMLKEDLSVSCIIDGAEIVQLYVENRTGHKYRPIRELKAFCKVFLKAGEERKVTFRLREQDFAYYDVEHARWQCVKGEYEIQIGASYEDIRLTIGTQVLEGVEVEEVNKREEILSWYQNPVGKPSITDFEQLYGKKIKSYTKPVKGEFTIMSTFHDMEGSFIVRQFMNIMKMIFKKQCGEDIQEYQFMIAIVFHTPIRRLVQQSPGQLTVGMCQGLAHIANGHFWKGIRSMISKAK